MSSQRIVAVLRAVDGVGDDALVDDGFEYYVPPVYPGGIGAKDLAIAKVTDCDNFVRGMADMARTARGD